jgi:type II secretory pathway component PulF
MNLTLSIILVVCVAVMTLLNIFLVITVSIVLFKLNSAMNQFARFGKAISDLSSGWAKIIPGVLSFLVDVRAKRRKKKKMEE